MKPWKKLAPAVLAVAVFMGGSAAAGASSVTDTSVGTTVTVESTSTSENTTTVANDRYYGQQFRR